jgi:hypothetical protein
MLLEVQAARMGTTKISFMKDFIFMGSLLVKGMMNIYGIILISTN